MNKLFFILSAAAFVTSSTVVIGASHMGAMPPAAGTPDMMNKDMMNKNGMMHKGMDMKSMDTNNDNVISKQEFMAHHEKMYDQMKKNKDGMVDMKDMGMMGGNKGMMNDPKK